MVPRLPQCPCAGAALRQAAEAPLAADRPAPPRREPGPGAGAPAALPAESGGTCGRSPLLQPGGRAGNRLATAKAGQDSGGRAQGCVNSLGRSRRGCCGTGTGWRGAPGSASATDCHHLAQKQLKPGCRSLPWCLQVRAGRCLSFPGAPAPIPASQPRLALGESSFQPQSRTGAVFLAIYRRICNR